MKKKIHFDSVGGASGNMILGALVALGADQHVIARALAEMIPEPFSLCVEPMRDRGLTGSLLQVVLKKSHSHDHHSHGHHGSHHHHHAPHRSYKDIAAMIDAATHLNDRVKSLSQDAFLRIAKAEAAIHGSTVDDIHFHEVGATDSIIDIVGACFALDMLGIDAVSVGSLPLGSGVIHCQHGTYPCPAPATLRLLENWPVVQTDEPHELVTPTGAALLMSWAQMLPAEKGAASIRKSVYAYGSRKLDHRPNVLRAVFSEYDDAASGMNQCIELSCNLDDLTPEVLAAACDHLRVAGALDVTVSSILMKKNRSGFLLSVLCSEDKEELLTDIMFNETGTLGLRRRAVERLILLRSQEIVKTTYGDVRVKVGHWKGCRTVWAPEADDCEALAIEHDVPMQVIYQQALVQKPMA